MNEGRCKICSSDRLETRLSLRNAPNHVQRLLTQEEIAFDAPISFPILECAECGLVQIPNLLGPDYYDDYVFTTSHSPQIQKFHRQLAFEFVSRFDLKGKRVIEIGCGDGNFLYCLQEAGAQAFGLEPSHRFRALALERGFEVLDGYFGRDFVIPGAPYDAVITRQVLEHVSDPNGFLQGVRLNLRKGGVGLVEVPSLEKIFEDGRFYDFYPDHLCYFQYRTLRFALEKNGLEVLEIYREMNGEFNVALFRNNHDLDFAAMQHTLNRLILQLRAFLSDYQLRGKRVAFWGAGAKGCVILALAEVREASYVVDSDPYKIGYFTPVSHLPIYAPEKLLSDPVDAIVITAMTYLDEILVQIRETLGFRGVVAALGHTLRIL